MKSALTFAIVLAVSLGVARSAAAISVPDNGACTSGGICLAINGGGSGTGDRGIYGTSPFGTGVEGVSSGANGTGVGVKGRAIKGIGVFGTVHADNEGSAIFGDANWSWSAWAGNYNGDVQARGFYESSDARLKTDIADAYYGLPEAMRLRPVTFKWKNSPEHTAQNGFIAQEVQRVFPGAVRVDGRTGMMSVDYIALLPVAIKAIQEQQATIKSQEARIAALERQRAPISSSAIPGGLAGLAALAIFPVGLLVAGRKRK